MKKIKRYLKLESKTNDEHKYVGVMLSPHIYNYITLYSLANNMAKSNIFKQIIENWKAESEENNMDSSSLISKIVIRVKEQWVKHRQAHPKASFEKFKSSIQSELMNKGLKIKQISKILSEIKDGEN